MIGANEMRIIHIKFQTYLPGAHEVRYVNRVYTNKPDADWVYFESHAIVDNTRTMIWNAW